MGKNNRDKRERNKKIKKEIEKKVTKFKNNGLNPELDSTTSVQNKPLYKNDLFDNPMVHSALKSLSKEQLEAYKKIGEKMFETVDFEGSKILNNLPKPVLDSAAYISQGLKSGLHPSSLDKDEVVVMKEAYGDKWFELFGWDEEGKPILS